MNRNQFLYNDWKAEDEEEEKEERQRVILVCSAKN